jgi:hypothetical protein
MQDYFWGSMRRTEVRPISSRRAISDFDFRRDLRFVDEQKRSIVQQELATESLSARTEFQFV